MRRTRIIALALFVLMSIAPRRPRRPLPRSRGPRNTSSASSSCLRSCATRTTGARPHWLPPHLLVFSATDAWAVEGMLGWSGSYAVFAPGETFVFSGNNNPLCALTGGKTESGGYGGLIDLNESTQPGEIDCVEQAETCTPSKFPDRPTRR